jgi:hypothetical protein
VNADAFAFLDTINRYSNVILIAANLLLVVLTGIYVVFTGRTVREMRLAREAELEAHLVVSLEPMGASHAKLAIRNAGGGPALDLEVKLSVRPSIERYGKIWRQSAIWPGQSEYFLLPHETLNGQLPTMQQLADEQYDDLLVSVVWRSLSGKGSSISAEYNLKSQIEGWYFAGALRPEQSVGESLKKLATDTHNIYDNLKGIKTAIQAIQYQLVERKVQLESGNDSAE